LKPLVDAPGAESRKLQMRILKLLGESVATLPDPGEAWADAVLADVAALPEESQSAWKRLFAHAQNSESAKPTSAWRKEAQTCVAAIGDEPFRQCIARWFGIVTVPPMRTVQHTYAGRTWENQQTSGSDRNISLLKGLAWICADVRGTDIARALAKLTEA